MGLGGVCDGDGGGGEVMVLQGQVEGRGRGDDSLTGCLTRFYY